MNRGFVYPGAIPLETDLLYAQQQSMVGLAKLCAAIYGAGNTVVNGLAVTQTSVPSMAVLVSAGEIYEFSNLEGTPYSSMPADTTHQVMKQGIALDAQSVAVSAPGTPGQSINYLIQAIFSEVDSVPVTLPYYNSSNPATAYSGPSNTGAAQYTRRLGSVILVAKAGSAATTGSQTTPAPDAGYIGLAVVTVANGASSVTTSNISTYAAAPVLPVGGIVGGAQQSAVAAGTSDALTANFAPAITALSNGLTLIVRGASANATTAPTFAPNGLTPHAIVKGNGLALVPGDIAGAGHWLELQYDMTLAAWVLQNPAYGVSRIAGVQSAGQDGPYTANLALGSANAGKNTLLNGTFTVTFPTTAQTFNLNNIGAGVIALAFTGTLPGTDFRTSLYPGETVMLSGDGNGFFRTIATGQVGIGLGGQTNQNLTGSRVLGALYTNNTGRPIMVSASVTTTGAAAARIVVTPSVGGVAQTVTSGYDITGNLMAISVCFVVLAGQTYEINATATSGTVGILDWFELR